MAVGQDGGGLWSIVEGSVTIRGGLVLLWQWGAEEKGHRRRQGSRNGFSLYALSGRGQGHSKGLRRDEILDESGKSMKY